MGLFADDTRFLSRWILTINGERPLQLSSDKVEYYSAAFYLRNPVAGGLEQDVLSIGRDRFIGDGMQEHIVVVNHAPHPVEFELALEVGTDFADIFAVKEHDFAARKPGHGAAASRPRAVRVRIRRQPVRLHRRSEAADPGPPLQAGRRQRQLGALLHRARAAAGVAPPGRRHPVRERRPRRRRARGAEVRGRALARPLLALRVAPVRPAAAGLLGRAGGDVQAVGGRPCLAPDGRGSARPRPASRGGDALVHDRLRPRHARHVPADAPLRARARAQRPPRPGRAAGDRRRPGDRRRARQDRPRGSARQGRRGMVPALLRHRRRDAALPRPPLRSLALDGRREARRGPARAGACAPLRGSTSTATSTATASSSTGAAPSAASSTSRGRTRATRSASTTVASRTRRSRRARCRATSTTPSGERPSSPARSGATRSSPTGSTGRRRTCRRVSRRRSGARTAAATTRSRSTGRSAAWTR